MDWVLNVLTFDFSSSGELGASTSSREVVQSGVKLHETLTIPVYEPKHYKLIKGSETSRGAWFAPVISEPVRCSTVRIYDGDCFKLWKEMVKSGVEVDVRFMACDPPKGVEGPENTKSVPPAKVCLIVLINLFDLLIAMYILICFLIPDD